MRKSTLGTHGVPPVRVDFSQSSPSMFGCGPSPNLLFTGLGKTPYSRRKLGSSKKKNQAVRLGSVLGYSILGSSSQNYNAPPRTRRCLYREENQRQKNSCAASSRSHILKVGASNKSTIPQKMPTATNLRVRESRIPKPGTTKGIPKPCSESRRDSAKMEWAVEPQVQANGSSKGDLKSKHNSQFEMSRQTDSIIKEQEKILNEMKTVVNDQKKLCQVFSDMVENHKEFIAESKQFFLDHLSDLKKSNETIFDNKNGQENVIPAATLEKEKKSTRKSLQVYKELQTQFQCLKTPTLSTRKIRTPRTKTPKTLLSRRVQAQLEGLFDD